MFTYCVFNIFIIAKWSMWVLCASPTTQKKQWEGKIERQDKAAGNVKISSQHMGWVTGVGRLSWLLMSQQVPTDFFILSEELAREPLGSIFNLHQGLTSWTCTVRRSDSAHINRLAACGCLLWCVEYLLVHWKVELCSYCGSMLRCVLQRATHLKKVEKGERQSDPLASITFRGKMCRKNY